VPCACAACGLSAVAAASYSSRAPVVSPRRSRNPARSTLSERDPVRVAGADGGLVGELGAGPGSPAASTPREMHAPTVLQCTAYDQILMICVQPNAPAAWLPAGNIRRSEIVRTKDNVSVLTVRDPELR
jgi:hypothetical protein